MDEGRVDAMLLALFAQLAVSGEQSVAQVLAAGLLDGALLEEEARNHLLEGRGGFLVRAAVEEAEEALRVAESRHAYLTDQESGERLERFG